MKKLEAVEDAVHEQAIQAVEVYEKQNVEQADRIATLEAENKKATSTKAYARVGGVIGFDNLEPQWGLSGAIGIRLGESLMLEAGANYMLGSFTKPVDFSFDLDRLQVTAGIGWEW